MADPARRSDAHSRLLASAAILLLLAAVLALSFLVSPAEIESGKFGFWPTCAMRRWFGMECPTCGMTRAFCALSHGQLAEAWAYNRAAPVVYLLAWLALPVLTSRLARSGLQLRRERTPSRPTRA